MTPQEQEAQVRLGQLRDAIARFNRERLRTEEYVRGVKACRVPREQVAPLVQSLRDARAEEEAARQLLDLQRVLLGREPTPGESAAGVPQPAQGLGSPVLWLGVIAGTFGLVSLFGYLAMREQRIQRELNPGAFTLTDVAGNAAQWLLPMAVVGGIIVGGYYLISKPGGSIFGGAKRRPGARLPTARLAGLAGPGRPGKRAWPPDEDELERNAEDEDDIEDEDEDDDLDVDVDENEEGDE